VPGFICLRFRDWGIQSARQSRTAGSPPCTYRLHPRHSQGDLICPPRAKAFTANLAAALVFTGAGSALPKAYHQPSRPPPDVAARPDPRPMAPMSPIGALGPTTARRSAVLMLGRLPAPTILEWF
jgi:hypothetical protein